MYQGRLTGISESKAVAIACGLGHMLCLTDKGKVYSWGTNTDGCLGRAGISKKQSQKISARHFDKKRIVHGGSTSIVCF